MFESEVRAQDFRAAVDLAAENGEGRVEFAAHADVMIPNARQQKDKRTGGTVSQAGGRKPFWLCREIRNDFGMVRADDKSTVRHGAPSGLQCEGRIVQVGRGVGFEEGAQVLRCSREGGLGPGGKGDQAWPARGSKCGDRGCFLEHDVGVCPAHARGHDTGPARPVGGRPRRQPGVDVKRRRGKSISGLGCEIRLAGICRCCSARAVLIRPAMPAAASRCPTFVFTEPIAQKPGRAVDVRKALVSARISMGSPTGVPEPCAST